MHWKLCRFCGSPDCCITGPNLGGKSLKWSRFQVASERPRWMVQISSDQWWQTHGQHRNWSFHMNIHLRRSWHRASQLQSFFSGFNMTSVFYWDGIYSRMYQQVCRRRSRGNRGRLLPDLRSGWKWGLIWCLIWDLDPHATAWRLLALYVFAAQADRQRGRLCYGWGWCGICLGRSRGGRLGRWGGLSVGGVKVRVAMIWGVRDGGGGQFEGGDLPLLGLRIGGDAAAVNVSGYSQLLRLMGGAWGRGLSALRVGIRSLAAQSVALFQNCSLTLSDC